MCSRDGAEISDRGYVGGLAWATAVRVRDDDACADDDNLYAGDGRDTKLGSFEGRRVPSKCFSTVMISPSSFMVTIPPSAQRLLIRLVRVD